MSTTPRSARRTLLALAGTAVLAAAGSVALLSLRGGDVAAQSGEALSIGGPFTLVNPAGQTVTERDLLGRYALIYFGYTFCPDVCPTTLNEIAAALTALGDRSVRITPVFISIDPQRDTPAVVGQYVAAFSPRLLGLTGTPQQIAAVARAYRVYYGQRRTGPGPLDYTMDHTSLLYLMGPDGRFIAPIRADQPAEQMAKELRQYVT